MSDDTSGMPPDGAIVDPDFHLLRQLERGICSEPDCDEPILGWCAVCDLWGPGYAPKWCEYHLLMHCARRTGHAAELTYDGRIVARR